MCRILLICISLLSCNYISSQEGNGWKPLNLFGQENREKIMTQVNNLVFAVDSVTSVSDRRDIILKTNKYLTQSLQLLGESEPNDTIFLLLVQDREGIEETLKTPKTVFIKNENESPANIIFSIYSKQVDDIKGGMIGMIAKLKWGEQKNTNLRWLYEGMVHFFGSKMNNNDEYSLEEKYVYLLQNEKLVDLFKFPRMNNDSQIRIAYNQSAYIVGYLFEKYGISKIKELWTNGMTDFERIYGMGFEEVLFMINNELNTKYNNSILVSEEDLFQDDFINSILTDWHPYYYLGDKTMKSKIDKNVDYIVNSSMDIETRNKVVDKTKEYIAENLALINETEFNDSLRVIVVQNRNELEYILGFRMGGIFTHKRDDWARLSEQKSTVYAIYNENHPSSLKHELMHAITMLNWNPIQRGEDQLDWLIEGIATLSDSSTYSCDGYSFEERYVALLQAEKLIELEELKIFPSVFEKLGSWVAYNQSAYIVGYLLEKYGVEKTKLLWQQGMDNFEAIYGQSLDKIILTINASLHKKYPKPIPFNWEDFKGDRCIE